MLVGDWPVVVSVGPVIASWPGHRVSGKIELVSWEKRDAFVSC